MLAERVSARKHDFMPASLLDSQLATLELLDQEEYGTRVDATGAPNVIIAEVLEKLH
jgi:gluconate kinase